MENTFKKITNCRCCNSSNLFKYLDLGNQPLANSYHKNESELPVFPLEVMLCEDCFHSQLSIVVDPDLMFKNYLYVSGTSKTFNKHCEDLAQEAKAELYGNHIFLMDCYVPPRVLDIACNDGTLLTKFQELYCEVYGVDPAKNLREFSEKKGIPVLVDYWNKDIVPNVMEFLGGKKVDIITGTNVFAHVDNIGGFLEACYEVVNDDGIVVLEFPYCDEMIKKVEFDTIYHEHLSYFLVNSFLKLAQKKNFYISKITKTPIHGGSIRFFLRKNNGNLINCDVQKLLKEEESKGFFTKNTYVEFSNNVNINKTALNETLTSFRNRNFSIVGFGASAKGNTMLNFFKPKLSYIVDENPLKWDLLTPGMNIPILSPEALKEDTSNLAVVILAWNFYDEIKEKIKKLRGNKNKDVLIRYVPNVQVENC